MKITTRNTKPIGLYQSLRALLIDVLNDQRTRVFARKAGRFYIGYWGRFMYIFLGV